MTFPRTHSLVFWLLALTCAGQAGTTVYQKPSDFIRAACGGSLPPTQALDLTAVHQARIKRLLGHSYRPSRVRYWTSGKRMVVILEEIGKTQAITTGLVVSGGRIEQVKVLIYRESIGSEVRRTSFTNQFKGASLEGPGKLSKRINNIAGATLSVRAVTEMARVALYLEQVSPEVR
ncbi:MAG: FMN-binding protein [Roseibacillus sp.]